MMYQKLSEDEATTEASMINGGYCQLSAHEIVEKISDKTVRGEYLRGFIYIVSIQKDGSMEGTNNVGTHNSGKWSVNPDDDTFTVKWNNGWDHTTTRAYDVDAEVKFYDSETGLWRTTFKKLN